MDNEEVVRHTGTISLIEKRPFETLEQQCKRILGDKYDPDKYSSAVEQLVYYGDELYIIAKGKLYRVSDTKATIHTESYCNLMRLNDNVYKYITQFCDIKSSLSEQLVTELEKL
jgi:hypothetical protein